MSKMIWEPWVGTAIAKAKEDMGLQNIWKYLRYYRMFIERFKWRIKGVDLTREIENVLFWRGQVLLVNTALDGLVVCEIDDKSEKKDANGKVVSVDATSVGGKKFKNVKLGKDAVIIYSDSTHLPPVLYIWALANEVLNIHDIIRQQNNMLRKPIIVSGEGAGFDEAMNKVMNVLSGVAWFNYNSRKGKNNAMTSEQPAEVLNLQVGNSYKGIELWDNVKHFEEYICDYLGYTTTKNEKRERMNTLEISNENSIGITFYKAQVNERETGIEELKKLGVSNIEFEKVLTVEEEVEKDDSKEKMDRTSPRE